MRVYKRRSTVDTVQMRLYCSIAEMGTSVSDVGWYAPMKTKQWNRYCAEVERGARNYEHQPKVPRRDAKEPNPEVSLGGVAAVS